MSKTPEKIRVNGRVYVKADSEQKVREVLDGLSQTLGMLQQSMEQAKEGSLDAGSIRAFLRDLHIEYGRIFEEGSEELLQVYREQRSDPKYNLSNPKKF